MDAERKEILLGLFVILVLVIFAGALFSLASVMHPQSSSQDQARPAPASTTAPAGTIPPASTQEPAREGYATIFYMKDYNFEKPVPPVYFNLVNPPLVIRYSVIPQNITHLKYIVDNTRNTSREYVVNITRPNEEAFFRIRMTSGEDALEDGYGKYFGVKSPNTLLVRTSGHVTIRMEGEYVNVTLSVEVPKEGNIS